MNSKLIKASVAGVAAIAVASSGSTFAEWTDSDTAADKTTGAGQLTIELGAEQTQLINATDRLLLTPGGDSVRDFYVASSSGDSVPNANLFITHNIVDDIEDGCTSTTSEAAAQATGYIGSNCADLTAPGQFSDQARVTFMSSGPVPVGTNCQTLAFANYTPAVFAPPAPAPALPVPGLELNDKDGQRFQVATGLLPSEGVCVRFLYSLPSFATDAVQGDSTLHNVTFDLEQV